MNFRFTSAQTSGENVFRINLLIQKNFLQISEAILFSFGFFSWVKNFNLKSQKPAYFLIASAKGDASVKIDGENFFANK